MRPAPLVLIALMLVLGFTSSLALAHHKPNHSGGPGGTTTEPPPTTTEPPPPPPPPPPPGGGPPGEGWAHCAVEWELCAFTGTKEVGYGADTRWFFKTLTDGTPCTNAVFGDPAPGTLKACWIRDTEVEPPPPPPPPGEFPASYFTGPSGADNIVPSSPNGAWIGADPQGGFVAEMAARVALLEGSTGRKLDLIQTHYASPRGQSGSPDSTNCYYDYDRRYEPFYEGREQWIVDHGSVPMVSWVHSYYVEEVLAGQADQCLARFAAKAAAFGQPFLLRMYWEFNGNWFIWSKKSPTNNVCSPPSNITGCATPAQHKAMWQHTVQVLRTAGATNARFVWCPGDGHFNNGDYFDENLAYPGDNYVDWVCSDGYNHNQSNAWCGFHAGWCSFKETFHWGGATRTPPHFIDAYGSIKPYVVGETGSVEDPNVPGRKGQWIRDMGTTARDSMPTVEAISYWDEYPVSENEGRNNWLLDTSQSSLDGWYDVLRMPYFQLDHG